MVVKPDFVNTYRVGHFKTLLVKPENRKVTILAPGLKRVEFKGNLKSHIQEAGGCFTQSISKGSIYNLNYIIFF